MWSREVETENKGDTMQQYLRKLTVGMGAALIALTSGIALAQQSTVTTKETRTFSVIAVDGNTVVIRDQAGTRELTVPPDFRVTVDGKQVTVAELKPGMTGTAVITTTTTTRPVTVTEVKQGEIVEASGNSILVRTAEGYKMFSPSDVEKRAAKIIKDGKPLDFSQLRKGDKLTATIVTEHPPQILTERQVQATLSGAPPPPPTAAKPATAKPAAATPPPPAGGTTPAAGSTAKKLPKTGSIVPLLGVTGVASLALGMVLTTARRRRATR